VGVLRSKGRFALAEEAGVLWSWSSSFSSRAVRRLPRGTTPPPTQPLAVAGGAAAASAAGAYPGSPAAPRDPFLAATTTALPPATIRAAAATAASTARPVTELVFIGIRMDEGRIRAVLDSALVTDEELLAYSHRTDPIPHPWRSTVTHVGAAD
jgi:hypothetical protein